MNWVRVVKSPAELAVMREAAQIMEHVIRTGIDAVQPGVRQCDAVAAIYGAQVGGVGAFGGEYTSFVPMLPTGVGTSTPHLTWSDAPFTRARRRSSSSAPAGTATTCRWRGRCSSARRRRSWPTRPRS